MKKLSDEELKNELNLYKHFTKGQIKFHEVDSYGVLHNIQYFYILEWARTKYLENVGIKIDSQTYSKHTLVMTVHHEMDYYNSASFFDEYLAYSRITKVGKSSLNFENIVTNLDGKILAKASVILVYLEPINHKPARIPEEIRYLIKELEGDNVKFSD